VHSSLWTGKLVRDIGMAGLRRVFSEDDFLDFARVDHFFEDGSFEVSGKKKDVSSCMYGLE